MENVVHVDKKWFDVCKHKQRYYLLDSESIPNRKVQSKSHIGKVMFLAAVARPRHNSTNSPFSGKTGIYPFTEQV